KDSILLKAFLAIVMLSFGIWGVGDFLTPGMDPNVAITVGKTDISTDEVEQHFHQDLDRFKQSLGAHRADSSEIRRTVLAGTVDKLTHVAAADAVTKYMGLVITKDRLRDTIRQQAAFKDTNGSFNQLQYTQALANNGLTEKMFVGMVMSDLRRQTILQPTAENASAPAPLIDALTAYRGETRIADTLLVSAANIPSPPTPTDDILKKVYDQNIATFTAPEYRKVTAVVIRAADLVTPDSLPEDQLKAYYDENIAHYRDTEKRHVAQLIFESKEQADSAKALMAPGDHLADIARKAKLSPPVDLGDLTRGDPLVKMLGSAYDLPVGQVSDAIQTDLGWHLFEVTAIKPEQTVPFVAVEDQIRKSVAEDKGTDALYDASTAMDDGVASGMSMDDLAKKVGGRIVRIAAVDRQGHDPNGLEAPGLFDNQHFLETAFNTAAGGTSKLMEIPKGYYVLTVEAVTPPAPRPLAEVRKDVSAIWEKQTRLTAAQDAATKIAAEIGTSVQVSEIAAKDKTISYAQLGPLTRFGEGLNGAHMVDSKRVSPELLGKLFAAKPGDVVTANVVDGAVVARLREIVPPADVGDTAKIRAQIAESVKEGIADDLVSEMSLAFASRYPARLNNATLDRLASGAN
ncbi:MAG: hypothetical protein EPO08_05400, partial [Rhodospirillaceae bacterium]